MSVVGDGVSLSETQPFMQKPAATLEAAFGLYGFLPEDQDPRWEFLARYASLQDSADFKRINFANAYGATYLSATASYRSGFVTTHNLENGLQLDRALDNLEHIREVSERFEASSDGFDDFDLRLVLTDRLTSDPTQPRQPVTPCPEALFQVRLRTAAYLGRVGFNMHIEQGESIMSIVNVQGVPGGAVENRRFHAAHGIGPFNLLVQRALAIAVQNQPDYEVRGLLNPEKGNSQLYWGVFSEEGVEMHHAHRKAM